ncbi:MAG TPA: histidine phosphatase family protein, partial [Patescibacteria group bacterium]|nr:histidine phosphatase family protein [Patescibacteria group bacterium]
RLFNMKTVYFIRHGQSEGNIGSAYQTADSPLTEKGQKQAAIIADRCARLPIETIISSTQQRAKSTASIIAEKTGHVVEFSDLFRERRKPTALSGKSIKDSVARELNERWWDSLMGTGPRVEDGENFDDLSARAAAALEYLTARAEGNILVITHGFFMRYIVARAIYGKELTGKAFEPMARSLVMENTGITVLRYKATEELEAWGRSAEWKLWIWNDHTHLG